MSDEETQQQPSEAAISPAVVIWRTVRKYWATAAATLLAVMTATVFYTLGQTKIYEAESTLHFDPNPPRPLGRRVESVVDMGAGNYWGFSEYYETQYVIIRSRRVALEVVSELGLHNDPAFLQNLPPDAEPEIRDTTSPELAAESLRGRLRVEPVRESRLARVMLRDADPKRAQRILTVLVETYVNQNLEQKLETTSAATDWLRNQLDTLKGDLETSELALHRYKKKNDILSVAFEDKSSMLSEEMKHINTELTRAKAGLQEVSARKAVLEGAPDTDPTLIQSSELLRSPLLNTLRADYERAVRERDALFGSKKGKNHPEVAAAIRKVEAAEIAILKEIKNVKKAVGRDAAVLARQAGGLKSMLNKAREQAHDLNLLEIEYNRLRRSKENTEKLYSLVLERTKEADLSQMMRVNNITVVDRPLKPRAAVHPKIFLNMVVGLFIGLFMAAGSAFARVMMDRTLKVPDDLTQELGVTFLGLVPEMKDGAGSGAYGYGGYNRQRKRHRGKRIEPSVPELVVHELPASSIAEASRAIRTNLMFMAPDNPFKTLLVTSAGPSEGKTTVACCIAIAMAQAGQRVALIDCDLRRPRLHRVFGKLTENGVTTVLLDGDFDAAIFESEVPNLSVMLSGPVPPNPAELFHTDRFKQLLKSAGERFDRVVIDSPPVAAVTDPTIISTQVDGTVLVARANKTRKELAHHALRSIRDVGGKLAGGVLNAVDFSRVEYKYSYYYYRRDEYYRPTPGDGDEAEESRPSGYGDSDSDSDSAGAEA